ncbi:25905_t:CDS:2 [Dentiscutata erythropus]|uniref:25905_t:CDS:1 n=1 Tax=Dentiscutata erythropus TaxID=1348616 RepID=A0A9N9B3A3_9GLOM|nr:25905_t:CDS:2 [Dentiscutata erythropus]
MNDNSSSSYPYAFEELKLYFLWTLENNIAPVFSEFIRLHIDFVARSPPESNQLSALQGAWIKRFTSAATILGISKVTIPLFYFVFNGIWVRFRPELRLKVRFRPEPMLLGNLDIGVVLSQVIMVEASVRFRPELRWLAEDMPDWSCVLERRFENRISSTRREKTFTMYLNENQDVGEQLLEGQRKQSNKKNVNLGSCSNEKDIENTTNKKAKTFNSSFDVYVGSNEGSCDILDFTEFDESYLAMNPEKMWRLKTGRKVEDIIYQHAKTLHKESSLHSFIVNDVDKDTKAIFSDEEWEEIFSTNVQKKPKVETSLLELIKKYSLDNVKDLRKSLLQPFIQNEEEFNRELHYDLDYINYAYRGMLFLWEAENNFTSDQSKLEGWFQSNVWSRIIDPAFHNTAFELLRGESMSFASSDRKNDGRTAFDRKKIGRKGDGIFRITADRMELGAVESGRDWEGLNGTKYLKDSLKLNKMLKDMITNLISECSSNTSRQLQVIGILNGGNRLQTIEMDTPKGYISRVKRGKIYEVTGRLTKSQPLAFVIKEILRAKATIVRTLNLLNNDKLNYLLDDDTDDDECNNTKNSSEKSRNSTPPLTLPKTFSTPHNERTQDKLKK